MGTRRSAFAAILVGLLLFLMLACPQQADSRDITFVSRIEPLVQNAPICADEPLEWATTPNTPLKATPAQPRAAVQASRVTTFTATDGEWHTSRASWYGEECFGNGTAGGVYYDENAWGVAHKELKMWTIVEIEYNGQVVRAPVFDRGPFVGGREFDLSYAVAKALGFSGVQTIRWRIVQ